MSIGELAREFGLSRGTLLHYDAIGLLKPSLRSGSRYRVYTDTDADRLRRICLYRSAGVPLADIRRMLDDDCPKGYKEILKRRFTELNEEIMALKRQQRLIVRLLSPHGVQEGNMMLNKEQWIALMRSAGLSDTDMQRWHKEFEKMSGEAHEEFMASLGIDANEIKQIRAWSQK